MQLSKNSLYRKIVPYMIAAILMAVILVTVNSVYVISQANARLKENHEDSLNIVLSSLNQELSNMVRSSGDFLKSAQVKSLAYLGYDYKAYMDTATEMQKMLLICQHICGMWLETENGEISIWSPDQEKVGSQSWRGLKAYFADPAHTEGTDQWAYVQIDGKGYIVYQKDTYGIRYGMWCDTAYVLSNMNNQYKETNTQVKLAGDSLPEHWRVYAEGGSDIVNGLTLNLIGDSGQVPNIDSSVLLFIVFGIGCIGLIILLWKNLQKFMIRPMYQLVGLIEKYGDGELDTELATDAYPDEIKIVGESLKDMAQNLKSLRIQVYEEALEKKDAQMQFMNSQIKPHFVLNAINTIYNMASLEQTKCILKICTYLSDYMRYVFSKKEMHCALWQEMEHLQEYIGIQQMRFPDRVFCNIEMDPVVMKCKIPTMAIHTCVENTFKHGSGRKGEFTLSIRGEILPEGGMVRIEISDTGKGFDPNLVEDINSGKFFEDSTVKSVGIKNTVYRFRALYEDAFSFYVENGNGAKMILCFPWVPYKTDIDEGQERG